MLYYGTCAEVHRQAAVPACLPTAYTTYRRPTGRTPRELNRIKQNLGGKKGGKGQKGAAASATDGDDGAAESLDDIAGIPEAKARFDKVLQVQQYRTESGFCVANVADVCSEGGKTWRALVVGYCLFPGLRHGHWAFSQVLMLCLSFVGWP